VAIAALVVWALTAAAGVYLLTSVMAAERAGAGPPAAPTVPDGGAAPTTTTPAASAGVPAPVTGRAEPHQAAPAGTPPRRRRGLPPVASTKVSAPPGKHPLLEFCHPALGITGLACWYGFVATHDRAFAWVAVAVLAVTIGAGLGWMATSARSARHRAGGSGSAVPAHRVVIHALAAAATCGLAVIAILAASHG
jgi:hypothetical protein